MVFKQTSQKFGQWADPKSSGVFGLGFDSEVDLNKVVFIEITSSLSSLWLFSTKFIRMYFSPTIHAVFLVPQLESRMTLSFIMGRYYHHPHGS